MKLYMSPFSPFARKVRVAVHELDLWEEVTPLDVPVSPVERNGDYVSVNPLRQIPTLGLADETVIQDSTVILLFLDDWVGGGRLLPKGPERWRTLTRHSLAQGMLEAAVSLRYETALRPEGHRWDRWIADRWSKIDDTLDWFEVRTEDLGPPFDMAQIGLACLLGYLDFRFPERHWRDECPGLASWYVRIAERPSMVETMPVG